MGLYSDKKGATTTPEGYELMIHESGHLEYDFGWHLGPYWSMFFSEMRDNARIMGIKCPECETVFIPPRAVCGRCYVELNDWVEVGDSGKLEGFTIVRFPYIDANNGGYREVPFTSIWITLDGADTRMMHFCRELDEKNLEVGMRMKAVWAKKPRPTSIHAISHFEIVPGEPVAMQELPPRMKVPLKMELPTKKTAKRKGAVKAKKK